MHASMCKLWSRLDLGLGEPIAGFYCLLHPLVSHCGPCVSPGARFRCASAAWSIPWPSCYAGGLGELISGPHGLLRPLLSTCGPLARRPVLYIRFGCLGIALGCQGAFWTLAVSIFRHVSPTRNLVGQCILAGSSSWSFFCGERDPSRGRAGSLLHVLHMCICICHKYFHIFLRSTGGMHLNANDATRYYVWI